MISINIMDVLVINFGRIYIYITEQFETNNNFRDMNIFHKVIWRFKHIYQVWYDRNVVPEYSEKRAILITYKERFGISTMIETGTFLGDTLENLRDHFKSLISFELSADLAQRAKDRFKAYNHIKIIEGDSGKELSSLLNSINQPCLFWLDGHYSSEFFIGSEYFVTAKGEQNTPVMKELDAIVSHHIKNHVILIDDARCFNGKNDYPTISEIRKFLRSKDSQSRIKISRDIIRITPA